MVTGKCCVFDRNTMFINVSQLCVVYVSKLKNSMVFEGYIMK